MLVSVETLKEYLGLPEAEDAVIDPILERSSMTAQSLAESYVGFGMEYDPGAPALVELRFQMYGVKVVRLPRYPAVLSTAKIDGVELNPSEYTFNENLGLLEFFQRRTFVNMLEVKYRTGFDPEKVPSDIQTAIVNMAIGVYENGGKITTQASGAGGALKSMTMFDAMSMSFDTAAGASGAGTPEGIVMQWAFVLDKYRVDKFVMGS